MGDCPVTAAGVRYALTGGGRPWALRAEREIAGRLAAAYPGLGRMIQAAYEWHRVTAARAAGGELPGKPPAGLVFVGAGLAAGLPLHAYADEVRPGTRVVYVDPAKRTAEVNAEFLADGRRVAVACAGPGDPAAVLGAAPCAELLAAGPVSVHLVACPSLWPPGEAAAAVAGYASPVGLPDGSAVRLRPGSTLCVTAVIPDRDPDGSPTPAAEAMLTAGGLAGVPGYAHAPEAVAAWIEGAGMMLPGGVHPVRTFRVAPRVPGRPWGAVAVVP